MKNKLTWILFGVGTSVGTFMFTTCNGPDASGIINLPNEAHIIRQQDQGLGGDVWFTMPATKASATWLGEIGKRNGFEPDSDTRWSKPADPTGLVGFTAYVETTPEGFHAHREAHLPKPETVL